MQVNGQPQRIAVNTTAAPPPGVVEVRFPHDFDPEDGALLQLVRIADRTFDLRAVEVDARAKQAADEQRLVGARPRGEP